MYIGSTDSYELAEGVHGSEDIHVSMPRPECMPGHCVCVPCPAAMQGSFMLCSNIMKEISMKSR
jgi:hypothetical protein